MKRITVVVLMLMAMATDPSFAQSRPVKITTSFYPLYIMALNVTRDIPDVTVTNLTPSCTGCPHDYCLTTRDMRALEDADILIVNGAGLEPFLEDIGRHYPRLKQLDLSPGTETISNDDGTVNPHLWVSISNAAVEVENLARQLSALDPSRETLYRKNAAVYIAKLRALRARMQESLRPFAGIEIVTFHEAFPYFAREFGLVVAAVIEREPGSAPSARELARTVELIRQKKIRAVFIEPQYPPRSAELIARETGARLALLDPAVTGPEDPDAYITIMESNRQNLITALADHI